MVRADPRHRTLPLPGALAIVVLVAVLLMAVASLQGVPRFGEIGLGGPIPQPAHTASTQASGAPIPQELPGNPVWATIASVIAVLVALAGLATLGWLLWRAIRALWSARPLNRRAGGDVGLGRSTAAAEEAVDAEKIRDAAADAQGVIEAHRDPGDAIIAAWVSLEEASARSGRRRADSETPGEFTVRILSGRPGLDAELRTLLGLYESVRFGGWSADEDARGAARRCLAAIEEGWR
ncbi:DUF4129 domain-containing protein [Microbacterium sp.]|uniref:DUF4129 domain-containing protein n=1 Tax=Microbacterium sp. TaxID=51671 RepID=UPI001AC4469D|nr:DUF4129 domain-containing protein [Microbacterium sp.]MBN9158238.1 DUF4129 domain-containing protein [Microbacterium sp.]